MTPQYIGVKTYAALERALTHWRRMGLAIEAGDMRRTRRATYEDYMAAIAILSVVLSPCTSVKSLLQSWEQQLLRVTVEQACLPTPARDALNPELLEGATYWRRFSQLVRVASEQHC